MRALILDCETTGLLESHTIKLANQPEVIEFYGVLVDLATGEQLKELDQLIKPKHPVSAEITKITSITNEMLKDAPPFSEVASEIFSMIEEAPLVIAHNASYDIEMLAIEAERLGRMVSFPRVVCTVEATIHRKGFRLSLSALYEDLFREQFVGAHRAKVDVRALARICVELNRQGEI